MKNNKPLRRLGAVAISLIVLFALMTWTAKARPDVTVVEKAMATILHPLHLGTNWVATRVRGVGEFVQELIHLRDENAQLQKQVQDLAPHDARNQMLTAENQTLRAELQMKQQAKYPLLTAQVISRYPDNWYRTVTIDRGSREGVQLNMAVVNWQGLVGKVSRVTPFEATVQLLVDAGYGENGFHAGAKVPSGETGVISTVQGGYVRLVFFSSEPTVQLGQPVFTSGQGIIPPDLLIGYVDANVGVGESGVNKFVNIRPAVDFHKLDVVHVVMAPAPSGGGATTP